MKAWRLNNQRLAERKKRATSEEELQELNSKRITRRQARMNHTQWMKSPYPLLVALLARVA